MEKSEEKRVSRKLVEPNLENFGKVREKRELKELKEGRKRKGPQLIVSE